MPYREFSESADEEIFSLGKGALHYLDKPFNNLSRLLPAQAQLILEKDDQLFLGEGHIPPLFI
jgi:hypothetical protein